MYSGNITGERYGESQMGDDFPSIHLFIRSRIQESLVGGGVLSEVLKHCLPLVCSSWKVWTNPLLLVALSPKPSI